ncbi:Fe2+-dependent dioxygenase [Aquabacterium sp. OR-4]|uniref:Fe2+-dependent dioxygenase n=1 Tax=Aquabacterium sp. OR-4 TaxID=2978127 RepID=UPI0028C96525|nr:Fe2+-dependent dioxygenase [Aquabacterium sp. OR-4]MDT7836653.1 Fe2+-dependent dioxygenase [Aquabacterium sp. OR-4]
MLLHLPQVLTRDAVASLRLALDAADWQAGATSAGAQAALVKHNRQLPPDSAAFAALSQQVALALQRHPLFVAAVLPARLLPPMFNRYGVGEQYGDHIDNTLQFDRFNGQPVRTDVSTTVFLSEPDEYDGGELVASDHFGTHEVKLAAGDAIVYPATSLHRVQPVTRGERVAAFLWTQSLVRCPVQRGLLFDLDMDIVALRSQLGERHAQVLSLTGLYHRLMQQWALT